MGYSLLAALLLLSTGALALRISQGSRTRRVALQRVGLQTQDLLTGPAVFIPDPPALSVFPPRYRWASPVAGLLAAALVFWLSPLPPPFSAGSGVLIAAIAYLLESHWASLQIERIESQLSDAIDLMVASLRAGSALLAALDAALREAKPPLRAELEAMIGRIRLGEDPRAAVRDLALRVPLESFRLFSHSLLVHWETGGSLATSLRTVGRTVRDRLEVSRRISAQAIEGQISVVAVMGISYGLTFLMMKANPGPIQKLLYSMIGSYIGAALMILQSIGMLWIWHMSRIRF
jgi:tight adherence protein B